MNNKIFISTGSLVERRNAYNYHEVSATVVPLLEKGLVDGAEFMTIKPYYENTKAVIDEFLGAGIPFPVLHMDKDIGTLLSDAAVLCDEGELSESKEKKAQAIELFKRGCGLAKEVGSDRMVLHLWGGLNSDKAVDHNVEWFDELLEISGGFGLKVIVENVPSADTDPLTNWKKIGKYLDRAGLIFDTRFATCHRQPRETLTDDIAKKIEHIHVSDYRGGLKEFSCLRPVWHPGEGICDYDLIFTLLSELDYKGTFTLEAPGIIDGSEINVPRLEESLLFIKNNCVKYFS